MEDKENYEVPRVYKVSRLSKKTGQPYTAMIIVYNGYQKMFFLEGAENFVFDKLPFTAEKDII